MRLRLALPIVIGCCLCSLRLTAQVKYSNEFLNLGVGARALSMSGTQTAVAQDVTAAYWNPAGLSRLENRQEAFLMHAEYFAGIAAYDYAGWAYRMDDRQALGVQLLRFAVDDIPNTTQLIDNQGNINYERISYFTTADWALWLTYARDLSELLPGLSAGGSAKIIRRRIGDFAGAWGFGLDAALQYRVGSHWNFGLVARDVTTTFNAWTHHLSEEEKAVFQQTGNELPENGMEYTRPHFSLGASYGWNWKTDFSTLIALDADVFCDGRRHVPLSGNTFSLDPHVGVELGYRQTVFLRAGVGNVQQETDMDNETYTTLQVNAGVGVCIKKRLSVDYALTDLGDVSLAVYSHVFSLKFAF
ncbi:MAG: PorV/PorQ family protein [Bacteroidales bacterium]|nr:PorV/PorQ family protein [Bacteroidales bacterium]